MRILNPHRRSCRSFRDINVGDVVLYGLIICLPIIQSDNLLKIPSISLCYYKLVSSLCDQHAECIFRLLNEYQYSTYLSTIKLGLDNYDNEICKLCFETIQNLALCIVKQQAENVTTEKRKCLEHFLEYLLEEVLTTTATMADLFPTLAETMYTLICAYPMEFLQALTKMKQQDDTVSSTIDQFVQNIGQKQEYNRKAKVSFTAKFESFVTDLRRTIKK